MEILNNDEAIIFRATKWGGPYISMGVHYFTLQPVHSLALRD